MHLLHLVSMARGMTLEVFYSLRDPDTAEDRGRFTVDAMKKKKQI